jgi:hypothetical protein
VHASSLQTCHSIPHRSRAPPPPQPACRLSIRRTPLCATINPAWPSRPGARVPASSQQIRLRGRSTRASTRSPLARWLSRVPPLLRLACRLSIRRTPLCATINPAWPSRPGARVPASSQQTQLRGGSVRMSLRPSAVGVVDEVAAAARWRVRERVSARGRSAVCWAVFFGVLPLRVCVVLSVGPDRF